MQLLSDGEAETGGGGWRSGGASCVSLCDLRASPHVSEPEQVGIPAITGASGNWTACLEAQGSKEPGKRCSTFYDLTLEAMQHHFCHNRWLN